MESARENKRIISPPRSTSLPPWWRDSLKRAFDVAASLLGMILLFPFFLPVAILLRREAPGSIFYRGPRTGRGGKTFDIIKFRTMYECPESYWGPRVTAKGDARITPLGRWLRDTKLNELPQLWNVLKGDMSLVGPRPEDPEIEKTWPLEIREEILSVRPGITSPASVLYRDEESLLPKDGVMEVYFRDILPDKLRLDRLYVRNYSFLGDLDILLWTFMSLLPRIARQRVPESKLFAGPLYRFVQRHVSWFVLDLLICILAVTLSGVIVRLSAPLDWGLLPLLALAVILALLFSAVNVFMGLDRIIWARAGAEDGLVLLFSNSISVVILLLADTLQERQPWMPLPALPAEMIVLIGVFTLTGSLFARYRMRLLTSFASRWLTWRKQRGGFGERVLILGAGEGGQIVNWLLQRGNFRQAFSVVGMVDDDPAKQGMKIDGCWVLGGGRELPDLVRKHDVGVILFAIADLPPETRQSLVRLCQMPNVRLVFLNDILGAFQSQLTK